MLVFRRLAGAVWGPCDSGKETGKLMPKVLVVGAGNIGSAIARLLHCSGRYTVSVVDQHISLLDDISGEIAVPVHHVKVTDSESLVALMRETDVVISACIHDANLLIAHAALESGVSYFDLTEDLESALAIRELSEQAVDGQVFVPQCGLAPGFISILSRTMADRFDSLQSVKMRVGALPEHPSNKLKYNLTWSTGGLINEYCNPCDVIKESERRKSPALEGLEYFVVDGTEYEAFNTSGGMGTLCETLAGKVTELDYKTIRYRGHQYLMQFLLVELGLGKPDRRALLQGILEAAIPMTAQDFVLIFVAVNGYINGRFVEKSVSGKIHHKDLHGRHWSSIQLTTASSVCAVVDLYFQGKLPPTGFVKQEQVSLEDFLATGFGHVFGDDFG